MPKLRLVSARDFFEHVAEPAYRQFINDGPTFLRVFSMASALYHMAEWTYYHDEAKVQAKFGSHISSGGHLWNHIEKTVFDAGFIRDLNNAGKHVQLDFDPSRPKRKDPSTGMHYAANTYISSTSFGQGPFGGGGGTAEVRMDEGGRDVSLEPIATGVFQFWKALIGEFYPPPVPLIFEVNPNSAPSSNS